MYVLRILIAKPLRFVLTVTGISLCVILILFILGVYNGVAEGSIEYIKKTPADIWVLQGYNTNIIRGTSILPAFYVDVIRRDSLIESATPVLLFLTNVIAGNDSATVLLTGYVPGAAGGPPAIIEGREIREDNDIILDKSFGVKHRIGIGDTIFIKDDTLNVVGLSSGTNAFVTQYAFVTLKYLQSIIELPGLASLFIIKAKDERSIPSIMSAITKRFGRNLSLFTHRKFLLNNIREMESGILPLFFAITVIGGIVLAIILSLILSVNILEKRRDFAVMKILGSPQWFLDKLIIAQALTITLAALLLGVAAYFPLLICIKYVSPEVTAPIGFWHIFVVTLVTIVISLLSSLLACKKTRSIYPLEVFQ